MGLPQISGLPDGPLCLTAAQFQLLALLLLFRLRFPLCLLLLSGQVPFLFCAAVHRLLQLADRGLDFSGVVAVHMQRALQLRHTAAGIACGGVDLRDAFGPCQAGVCLQGRVAVAGVVFDLQIITVGLRLFLGVLNHFRQAF